MGSPILFGGNNTSSSLQNQLLLANGQLISANGNINYIKNNAAELGSTTGWATYADAAANIPVDGTGGSPNSTWTITTSSPLRGAAGFLWTKSGSANRQGEGVSYAFTIDSADMAKPIAINFSYIIGSGIFTAADGITAPLNDGSTSTTAGNSDLEVFIEDVTNSVLIPVSPEVLVSNSSSIAGTFKGLFQTSPNSTSYRLIIHTATTTTNNYTVQFDNFFVGPQAVCYGAAITDWNSFTMTIGGSTSAPTKGTVSIDKARWRRVGDSMEIEYDLIQTGSGSAGSGTYLFPIPVGSINTTLLSTSTTNAQVICGFGSAGTSSTGLGSLSEPAYVIPYNSTNLMFVRQVDSSGNLVPTRDIIGSSVFSLSGANIFYTFRAVVPISGWSSTVLMSNDTDTRVCAAIISGDPASATSGNPIIVPTVVYDSHGGYNASTGRYTVPVSGIYKMYGALQSASSATTLTIYKNAVSTSLCGNLDSNGEATYVGAVNCTAGDVIDIRPGGTVDATNMTLNIERLSGPASIAATDAIACRYSTGAGATLTNGVITFIDFGTKDYDYTNSVLGAGSGASSTYTSTWRFVCPAPGRYLVTSSLREASNASNGQEFNLYIYINGSLKSRLQRNIHWSANGDSVGLSGSDAIKCVAGDIISIAAMCSGTNALNTTATDNHAAISYLGL